jgi:transcriptional regulator of acetoin/glycerol metabolism
LRVTRGSVSKAAKLLGIGRATLYRRIASLELSQDVA